MVERFIDIEKVTGSIPVAPTEIKYRPEADIFDCRTAGIEQRKGPGNRARFPVSEIIQNRGLRKEKRATLPVAPTEIKYRPRVDIFFIYKFSPTREDQVSSHLPGGTLGRHS